MRFRCPGCEDTWDGLESWEEEMTDLDTLYENLADSPVPDPPLDSLVALLTSSLEVIADELRGTDKDGTLVIHCTPCSIEMAWKGREPAFNMAVIAGAKRDDLDIMEDGVV